MLRKAMEYLQELAKPNTIEKDGQLFTDKDVKPVIYNPKATNIQLTTLSALVDYCKSGADSMSEEMFIHIVSPTEVALCSTLDAHRKRECLATVNAMLPVQKFNSYIQHEEFCIALQSKFEPIGDRELLLKFAGTVESGSVAEYGDDGITQKATIKNGVASKTDALVPNPVTLYPYRTFLDVFQPASKFVFRMNNSCGVSCALFEADGGAWKQQAMESIQKYLEGALAGVEHTKFIILR